METKVYSLRPHHGMCLAYFEGKGYSNYFTMHMQEMLDFYLCNPDVCLCISPDEICTACPNRVCEQKDFFTQGSKEDWYGEKRASWLGKENIDQWREAKQSIDQLEKEEQSIDQWGQKGKSGTDLVKGFCKSEGKVADYDRAVLSYCGLSDGMILPFHQFTALVEERILFKGERVSICGDCLWNEICQNGKSRWRR